MKRFFTYLFISLGLLSMAGACADEKVDEERVFEIRRIGMLSTTEYTIGKIIRLDDVYDDEDSEWYEYYKKYGERKILISCRAKVKAGVDLSKLSKDDIEVKGTTIIIHLPAAEITSFSIDPRDIRTEAESITGFRSSFSQEEKNSFLKQAEESMREDLESTGILKDARENAEAFLTEFYEEMGFKEVIIESAEDE